MMESCIFCKIALHTMHSDIVLENDSIIAFNDIEPVAPVHILIIPKKHYKNIEELYINNNVLVNELIKCSIEIAKLKNINNSGYRLFFNTGKDAGQLIDHVHCHIVGGAQV